jgi:mannitol 2-dehydrogenase
MTLPARTSVAPHPLTHAIERPEDIPSDGALRVPSYDPANLRPGVVHFGVGGFHRAHQAVYFDELADRDISLDWGIIGVGMHRREMGEVLGAQSNLFTVVKRDVEDTARVVGSIVDYLYALEDPEAVLSALADEQTRLVTLTITASSYPVDPATCTFRTDDDGVIADLDDPEHPSTVFGYIVEGLRRRREAGLPPFTVLPCDNMRNGGAIARTAVVHFARLRDPDLADWIDREGAFPASMVDRITPTTSPEDRDAVVQQFGVDDRWPVLTEPFTQWIIEDRFCNGRPPLEAVGVRFVEDVAPFEVMKTRMLNAGHCALGFYGLLLGHRTTVEAMGDELVRAFLTAFLDEVAPLLPEIPDMDLTEYRDTLLDRLSNPHMEDQLERLTRRSSSKVPDYVLPSLVEALGRGSSHRMLLLTVAGWFRYLTGVDEQAIGFDVQDARVDELQPLAREARVEEWIADKALSADLEGQPDVSAELAALVRRLQDEGVRAVLTSALTSELSEELSEESGADEHPASGAAADAPALDTTSIRVVLCDADGNLFPSEELAFEASTEVTNRLSADVGVPVQFEPEELRQATLGKNFRRVAAELTDPASEWPGPERTLDGEELEEWVAEEKDGVSEHLRETLQPDDGVTAALEALAEEYGLAVVSSSATSRLEASFEASGLTRFFPADRVFSAEDSMPAPVSKPDPAVYLFALHQLGVPATAAVAIEDSVTGATSAVAAGCLTIGNVCFVDPAERAQRRRELEEAGVAAVVESWPEIVEVLRRERS